MAPGKRKATGGPGPRPLAPAAPGSPRFLPCPTCGKSFVTRILQQHAWNCVEAPQQQQMQQQSFPSSNSVVDDEKNEVEGKFVYCPMCSRPFPHHAIEAHAWGCSPPTEQHEDGGHVPAVSSSSAAAGKAAAPSAVVNTAPMGAGGNGTPTEKKKPPGYISGKEAGVSAEVHGGAGASEVATSTTASSATAAIPVQVTVPPTSEWGSGGGNAVQASPSQY